MKTRQVIVVGGGASGLTAAISAAENNAAVTILEQKERVGKKILSTGNGRCNVTNTDMRADCFRGEDVSIVPKVLERFGYPETVQFFEKLGVILKNRQGYLYPISDQASTILDALRLEADRLSVQVVTGETVCLIEKHKKRFSVRTKQSEYHCDAVILATGGKAAPVLGSDGSGYALAKSMGHTISPVVPALVQLRCRGTYFKQISGVRVNAAVHLFVDGTWCASDTGELQLTDYGISGIPVFQVSRYAAKALYEKRKVTIEVNFLPTMTEEALFSFLEERRARLGHRRAEDFLLGMFHKKLIGIFLKEANIPANTCILEISETQWRKLCTCFCHFPMEIEGTNTFAQAQVCAGGVKTTEIHAETMESRYVKDLYLTGELLDIDGICGGYNLQWAWATGYLAGSYAAKGTEHDSNRTIKTTSKSQ